MKVQDTTKAFEGKLPHELRKNRFDYKLVKRTKEVAIYSQHDDDKAKTIIAYEVFRITWKKGAEINGLLIKAGEKFPGDGDFGKTAYACRSLETAEKRFKELEETINNKKDI